MSGRFRRNPSLVGAHSLDDLGQDAQGDFFGGLGADVQTGRIFDPLQVLIWNTLGVEVVDDCPASSGAGDESEIGGLSVEYGFKSFLVVVAHCGDHNVAARAYRFAYGVRLPDQCIGVGEQLSAWRTDRTPILEIPRRRRVKPSCGPLGTGRLRPVRAWAG